MWTKTVLWLPAGLLWATVTTSETLHQPGLTDRAFTLALAAAITTTALALAATIGLPLREFYRHGVEAGRWAQRLQDLNLGRDEPPDSDGQPDA